MCILYQNTRVQVLMPAHKSTTLLMQTMEAAGDSSGHWALANHVGDLDWAPGFWLQHQLSMHLHSEPVHGGSVAVSQIKNKRALKSTYTQQGYRHTWSLSHPPSLHLSTCVHPFPEPEEWQLRWSMKIANSFHKNWCLSLWLPEDIRW